MWTIKKILDWSFNYFNKKKVNQPKLSAELLLASVLNFTRMQLYLNYNLVLNKEQLSKFKEYVIKRANHMPVQYILKESHFRNLKLYVDENVLIPRPETELLVDKTLELIFENTFLKKFKELKLAKEIRENKEPEAHKEPEEPEELKGVKEPKKSKKSKEFEEFRDIRHILNIFNSGHNLNSGYNTFNIDLGSFYILEIGTGSGAIALSIIQEIEKYFQNQITKLLRNLDLNQIKVDFNDFNDLILEFFLDLKIAATEKSKKALDIAVENYENLLNNLDNNKNKVIDTSKNKFEINNKDDNLIDEKVIVEKVIKIKPQLKIKPHLNVILEFYNADIIPLEDFSFLEKYNKKINLVVSNPPYIKEENFPKLPQEVKDFEPSQALVAGKKGTEVYENIMKSLASLVANDCIFIFETDPLVVNDLKEMLISSREFKISQTEMNIEKDYNLLERIIYFKMAK